MVHQIFGVIIEIIRQLGSVKTRLEDAISITPYILSASEGCAGALRTSPTRRLEDATLVFTCLYRHNGVQVRDTNALKGQPRSAHSPGQSEATPWGSKHQQSNAL